MILLLKVKKMFLKWAYEKTKSFYDNLNIVVILAPGRESFSTKCAQFPLTSTE